jgi:hypothetical protein
MEDLHTEDYASVLATASQYRVVTRTPAVEAELHVLESIALEHLGDLDGAIAALDSAESVAGGTVYAGEDFSKEKQGLRDLKAELVGVVDPVTAAPGSIETTTVFVESTGESFTPFPNPAVDWLEYRLVDQSPGDATIRVYDVTGRTVVATARTIESNGRLAGRIQTGAWARGTYFIRIVTSDGSQRSARFVKR